MVGAMMPRARFDDLTPGRERCFAFHGRRATVAARTLDEVIPALREVEDATRAGLWAAGYVSYEAAPAFDQALQVRTPQPHEPLRAMPLVSFGLYLRREECESLEPRSLHPAPYTMSAWAPEIDRGEYERGVGEIRDAIGAGDTYQVNYTMRLRAAFSGDPGELYRDLVLAQRGAHAACIDAGRYQVASISPEKFFRIDGDRIEVRPMKGTIRRGRWPEEDDVLADALARSEKDRAENLMIVDLLRNDLGRIAEFGSVEVDSLLDLERFETVWQLTSEVSARLRPRTRLRDVFRALFPSGSVTGAPKARTMEIIAALEHSTRGVYCGAVGYVAPDGAPGPDAEFNVAIRTVVVDVHEGLAEYGVGGGITWDSDSAGEYEEARLKAQLLVERRPEFLLIETLRWDPEEGYLFLPDHLERLAASAAYFGFPCDREALTSCVEAAVDGAPAPRRVRLVLARDGACRAEAEEQVPPWLDGPEAGGEPIMVAVDPVPVTSSNVFLFHKTTQRKVYDDRIKRHPTMDDVVLQNERGEVTETTIGNLAVRFDGHWYTPPLGSGCLGGVYRQRMIDAGLLEERVVSVADLPRADGVAVLNSVRGWRSAVVANGAGPS
jgi:para-aminobenzoate synthetase/4-amino-4-deoxychorismate lyase